jgi:hypothetical protein
MNFLVTKCDQIVSQFGTVTLDHTESKPFGFGRTSFRVALVALWALLMPFVLGEAALRCEGLIARSALYIAMSVWHFWAVALGQVALSAVFWFVVLLSFGAPVIDTPVLVYQLQMLKLVIWAQCRKISDPIVWVDAADTLQEREEEREIFFLSRDQFRAVSITSGPLLRP